MLWLKKIANILLVTTGVSVCLYGAVNGIYLVTTAAVLLLLLIHIVLVQNSLPEACLIILAGIFGSFVEVINISLGLYDYIDFSEHASLLPTWIVLIWFLVGSAIRHSLSVFSSKTILIPVAGLIGAIFIFSAGALSGAIRFQPTDGLSIGLAILSWSTGLVIIVLIGNKLFDQLSN